MSNLYHGDAKGGKCARLYNIWTSMKQRCHDENHKEFHRYGGRGISICPEWLYYLSFKEWALASGYADNLCIDRINNDKGYHPGNCQWITRAANSAKQAMKVRRSDGKIFDSLLAAAREAGCSKSGIDNSIRRKQKCFGYVYSFVYP